MLISGDVHPNPGPNKSYADFTICHANIRSLSEDKLRRIKTSLANEFDIIALSETFLSSTTPDSKLELPGFNSIIRRDRTTGAGGGVAFYASRCLVTKRREDIENQHVELLWVEVRLHNNKFLFGVVYRPPNAPVSFWDYFQDSLDKAKNSGIDKVVIMGDLNADPNTNHGRKLIDFCSTNSLAIHVKVPTRITETSSSCLDQIISNIPNFITTINVSPPLANCDHSVVSATLLFRRKKSPCYTRFVWNYDKANFDIFREKLNQCDWGPCFDSDDIDSQCSVWSDTFLNVARDCIPNKNVTIRPDDAPWYTNALRALKNKVERIHRRAKKQPSLWPYFRQLRNKYVDDLRLSEQNYYKRLDDSVNNVHHRKKSWWHTVKSFMNKHQPTDIPAILHDNLTYTDNDAKAQILNDVFLRSSFVDDTNFSMPTHNEDTQTHANVLSSISINSDEVLYILQSLDTTKASGPDGISARLLKEAAPAISESLTRIFNNSLLKGSFPSEWKKANVVPILKKGSPNDCNNYRPISLLSCVAKVFERVIFKHVFNFFRDNHVVSDCQSGFIPCDNTINQLLFLYHHFCEAVDLQKEVRIIFCDISKAFDRVYHPGLLHKLEKVGITGPLLIWFQDYLRDRHQRVVIQGGTSSWGRVEAGVPQGSVLGPLLFLIYINDIVNVVRSPIRLFADDTTLFITVDDPAVASASLNSDLQEVERWSQQWLVVFNPFKTKSMIISRKRIPRTHPDITFMNQTLQNDSEHKHLGLILRSDLRWSSHISEIRNKSMKMVNILKHLQMRLSRRSLEILYLSFIRPIMEYGSVVWDGCTSSESDELESVQLAAARVITGAIRGTRHELIYEESGLEKLSKRREISKLTVFYKIVHGLAPTYLQNLLPDSVQDRNRCSVRSNSNLSSFRTRTSLFSESFFPATVRLWNNLPLHVRNSETVDEFKSKIKKGTKKCPKLYYIGERRIAIFHARLRMKCSKLHADLFHIGIADSPRCACGTANEDAFHYFCECPKYRTFRDQLQSSVLPLAPFTIQTLLYGSKICNFDQNVAIFEAVHRYIHLTARFDHDHIHT